jgi:hypothetical protein
MSLEDLACLSKTMYLAFKGIEVLSKDAHLLAFESFGIFRKTPKTLDLKDEARILLMFQWYRY